MTFRGDDDALRAKLEAAEAENERLREELQHEQGTLKAKIAEERREARRARWARVVEELSGIGSALGVLFTLGALLVIVYWACSGISMLLDQQSDARHQAETQRLEALRAQVPDGIDPRLWSWCVSHCIRYGQHDTDGTYEGIVTEIFIDHADGQSATRRATVEGPWLNSSGATAITTSDITSAFHRGDMVIVRHTDHSTFIEQAQPDPPIRSYP